MPALGEEKTVILSRGDLLYLEALALDLLHKERRSGEGELAIIQAELTVFVASNGEEFALLGEDQGMGATAGHGPDQYVEAEALWHVNMSISVVLGGVLAMTELPIVVTSL